MDVFHRDVDDAFDAADQEPLDRAVEFGDDQVTRRGIGIGLTFGVADGQAQVQHRHRTAAHVGHAGELAGQAGYLEQFRAAQHFLHLEDIDAKKLTSAEAEQQQRQAIVAGQSGSLVDPVEQVMGHGCCIGAGRGELEGECSAGPSEISVARLWHAACTRLGQVLPTGGAMRRIASFLAIAMAVAAPWATAADWQPVASIRAAALSTLAAGTEGEAVVADALRLPKCGGALQVQPTANTTVEVSCPDAGGWRLFVPVKVRRNQTVLVLTRGIGTGESIAAADISTAQRDAARIAGAVLADPAAAIGRIARRPLPAGTLLSSNDLVAQRLIKRGDSVALVSRRGSVEVRIAGRALGDAGQNERVSVENLSSRRIVQGTVDATGDVIVAR